MFPKNTSSERITLYQLILALATITAVSVLGVENVLTSDAVTAIITSIVVFVTSSQGVQHRREVDRELNGSSKDDE